MLCLWSGPVGIQLHALLNPICLSPFYILILYVLGDDSLGFFMQIKHLYVLIHIRIKG